MVSKGCLAFLAHLKDDTTQVPPIESISIVREFLDVFPADLPGMPTDRRVRGPIATLSLGDLKRRHLMLSSQVIFWFVIAWLLYCLILDTHFHMYRPHFLMV